MTKKEITTAEVMEEEALIEEEKILEEEAAAENESVEETEEQTEQEEKEEQTEEKDSDDEFMQDLIEAPLDAEKARKQKESLLASIESCQKTVESLKDLAEANKSGALKILKEKVKDSLTSSLEEEDIKELKDGVKQLECVKVTLNLISSLCGQYSGAKSDIERYKNQLEELKERSLQLGLPFEEAAEQAEAAEEGQEQEAEAV